MTNIVDSGKIHSPYALSDKPIGSSGVARSKGYSDLDLSLRLHPIRKDIVPLKDDQALKNSVKNLILTNFFERPFQSNLGGNLRGILFEPADAITELALEDNIKRVLKREPRIKTLFVEVIDLADNNAYRITVKFLIKQFDTASQVEIVLRRLR
jgi:phage baseplate assembly protein W